MVDLLNMDFKCRTFTNITLKLFNPIYYELESK